MAFKALSPEPTTPDKFLLIAVVLGTISLAPSLVITIIGVSLFPLCLFSLAPLLRCQNRIRSVNKVTTILVSPFPRDITVL